MKFTSTGTRQTNASAIALAEELIKSKSRKATVIALTGNLGAGKTTFVKGFARGLGIRKKIVSPTFIIMRKLHLKNGMHLYHIDAYRVGSSDFNKLGFKEFFKEPNIIIIEWAERLKKVLPRGTIWINFEHGRHKNERYITFNRR